METLEQLNAFNSEGFESWLDNRLRKLHDPDENVRYRAWELDGVCRGDCESTIDAFGILFRKLSVPAQEAFQEGAYRLVTRAQVGNFPLESMKDLMMLSFMVKASKVLDNLERLIIDSPWGKSNPSLIYDSIGIIMSLGVPTEELRKKHGFR
jgi:hypothetical protein